MPTQTQYLTAFVHEGERGRFNVLLAVSCTGRDAKPPRVAGNRMDLEQSGLAC